MQRKKLEDLNLIDDFMFFTMLNDEVVGEEFGRKLLEIIFDRKFGKLKVIPQKVYYGSDTDKHGVRLDVYLEEEMNQESLLENAIIYDIETESEKRETQKDNLPQRVRFYHAKIDSGCLGSGLDYKLLKKVIVVMIMPFDPFGYDYMVYTIKNTCLEVPELPYDDGAKTLFLYTNGKKGNPSEALRELLRYMEESREENVKNEDLKQIHNMVMMMKRSGEVSLGYMKIFERERMLRQEGIEEGLERGEIIGLIKTAREYGASEREIFDKLVDRYKLGEEEARELCSNIV